MIPIDKMLEFIYSLSLIFIFVSCFAVVAVFLSIKQNIDDANYKQFKLIFFKVDRNFIFLILSIILWSLTLLSIKNLAQMSQSQIMENLQAKFVFIASPLILGGFFWFFFCKRLVKILCSLIHRQV